MSQPTSSYQQPPYPDGFKANNQSMPPPSSGGFVNGQIMGMQNIQNGTQLPSSFNQTGMLKKIIKNMQNINMHK